MAPKKIRTLEIRINEGYTNLISAIILQAITDYIAVTENDRKDPNLQILFGKYNIPDNRSMKKELDEFFNSEWFQEMNPTSLTGMELVDLARKYGYTRYSKRKPSCLKYFGKGVN